MCSTLHVFNLLGAKCLLEYGTVNIPYSRLENEISFHNAKIMSCMARLGGYQNSGMTESN